MHQRQALHVNFLGERERVRGEPGLPGRSEWDAKQPFFLSFCSFCTSGRCRPRSPSPCPLPQIARDKQQHQWMAFYASDSGEREQKNAPRSWDACVTNTSELPLHFPQARVGEGGRGIAAPPPTRPPPHSSMRYVEPSRCARGGRGVYATHCGALPRYR